MTPVRRVYSQLLQLFPCGQFAQTVKQQFFRPESKAPSHDSKSAQSNDVKAPTDVQWEAVTLPHSVRLEPREVCGGRNYQDVCWYKRELLAKPEWKGRVVYLKFQGAMQVADVWLNGVHQTTHFGRYIPFSDAREMTYPSGDDMVTFSVGGEGALIGDERIFANPVRAEAGIATALVRMTRTAGPVSVSASSPGLKGALLEFRSLPVVSRTTNGSA
jgi:hypothetical protein